ncbi:hypothetical protein HMPREF1230_1453 [Streptococcus pyogenes GA19681]|nr:hypothetical protein HMPREF1230_1453 [Streptococcus pyogenes GA19681]ESA45630.1 hypothetical protein HMPREF1234_1493 [Streptococcus pyogenes GA41039]ESA48802.1 hypothetical protein HMPREF1235_1497 [Streptococcus pyogenes GA41208]
MEKVAHVIVDIPLMQTDKPFSYGIPKELVSLVQLGSRVHVPFGKGNRLLQGFIIGFGQEDSSSLKLIQTVLDPEPVLNQEQLTLADQLRKTVFSYKITLLKAMIPNLLNSNYDKVLRPESGLKKPDRDFLFEGQPSVLYSTLDREKGKIALKGIQAGHITVSYLAKDKKT